MLPVGLFARSSLACHVKKGKANYGSHEIGIVMGSKLSLLLREVRNRFPVFVLNFTKNLDFGGVKEFTCPVTGVNPAVVQSAKRVRVRAAPSGLPARNINQPAFRRWGWTVAPGKHLRGKAHPGLSTVTICPKPYPDANHPLYSCRLHRHRESGVANYGARMYYNPCLKGRATVMRQFLITITLVLAVMFPEFAKAADAPDFSGTWVLNVAKSTLPKDSTTKSETIVIENKKSAIVFHYKTDGKKSTETYTPDGKKRFVNMSSGQLTSSASWHDSVLVIESTLDIKIPNATVVVTGLKPIVDTWTLAADGRTLTHDAGDHKEIYVYEKQ